MLVTESVVNMFTRFNAKNITSLNHHDITNAFKDQGCIVLENYLPAEQVKKVREEALRVQQEPFAKPNDSYERVKTGFLYSFSPYTLTKSGEQNKVVEIPKAFSNPLIDKVCSDYLGLLWFVESYVCQMSFPYPEPLIGWHCDHYSNRSKCIKLFLYLNDIDTSNGAFCYLPRSHKLIHWLGKHVQNPTKELGWLNGIKDIAEKVINESSGHEAKERKRQLDEIQNQLDFECKTDTQYSVAAPAGSLLIFDTTGLHRGGTVHQGERLIIRRQTRQLDLHQLKSWNGIRFFLERNRLRYSQRNTPLAAHL